ncbi:hypothetical protein PHET_03093 [Paragonimus heterotremus]|uniref:Uncharacterized protein n=1 Tax=Paragonimus heterotremus TaxID=100268 RepID=A0A8J4WK30_9TREM|nr:hypothetical protein PHET_03093 [Paragonimus heterotremus]
MFASRFRGNEAFLILILSVKAEENKPTMPLSSQTLIVENFVKLTNSLQPYETGGVLNYVFEPVTNATTSEVLLKAATFNGSTIKDLVTNTFLKRDPSFRVLDVLPPEVRPTETGGSNYLLFLAIGTLTFLITLALVIATLIIPCIRQRSGSKGKGGKTSYIALGITTLVLLVFAVFCFIFACLAFDYVIKGVGTSSDTPSGNSSGLRQTLNSLFNETKQLLQEVPENGRRITNLTLHSVQDTVFKELGFLIPDILDQLLVAYNARALLDLAKELVTTVGWLGNTTNFILTEQEKVVQSIQSLQENMRKHQKALNESLQNFCPKVPREAEQKRCQGFASTLTLFDLSFNTSQLLTGPSKVLSSIASVFGTNMTQLLEQFSDLDGKFRNQTDAVLKQIRSQINLQPQFQSVLNIWDGLSGNVMQPVIGQLDRLQPTVDSATKTVANVMPIVGYVLCVIYILFFVVIIVYLVLTGLEAKDRDLLDSVSDPKGTPRKSRYPIVLGQCLPLFAIIIVPILVILGVILISVVGVLNNEGCRYVERDTGIRITDATLNLYLKYTWPKLIAQQRIDPRIISLLDLPAPQNVYSGLRFTCQRSMNSTTQPGLLPSVGLKNIVNVSAVVYQPDVQKVINDNEKTLVDKIKEVNFSQVIPANLDELLQSVNNITKNLKEANYSTTIDILRKPIVDVEKVRTYLNQLRQMVDPFVGTVQEAAEIKKTTEEIEVTLRNVTPLNERTNRLADAFDNLWKSENLTVQLNKLNSTVSDAVKILKNNTALAEPVSRIYKESMDKLFRNLTRDLEQVMTRFTTNVLLCDRLNVIFVSVLNVACGSSGMLNRIGAYMFTVLLLACPLVLTVLLFQLFLRQHQRLCLNSGS